jgi:glycosyltransferase involved in cell wall biosynthesis
MVVAPSQWLTSIASAQLESLGISVSYVPNFHPESRVDSSSPKETVRDALQLRLGIAGLDPDSYLKGGDLLPEIQKQILVKALPVDFVYLRDFENTPSGSSKFWDQVDYLLVLSRADNSPNVIHEARINGVKVVGTNVGGITELLVQNFDIPISLSNLNPTHIVNVIESIITSRKLENSVKPPKFEYSLKAISGISSVYTALHQK